MTLLTWINSLIKTYKIDGIRVDTVPLVPKWFWKEFKPSAGVFGIGEIADSRLDYVSDYQKCCFDSVLNYPLFFTLRQVFTNGGSFLDLEKSLRNINEYFKDSSVLGVFVDNHDKTRFLHDIQSVNNFKNAIAFSILTSRIL
jgi:alpha-amylase